MRIIKKAIEILREHGWIRGEAHNKDGYCMIGALDQAGRELYQLSNGTLSSAGRRQIQDARNVVTATIRDQKGRTGLSIPEWNDNYCRDIDDAIHMLKLADENAESGTY